MQRQVVYNIMERSLHRTARRTDMAAAAKKFRNLRHIYLSVRAQAYLILQNIGLVHKNRALHSPGIPKLVDNSLQIGRYGAVKIHGFFVNHADHASAVHKEDALKERPAQYLILDISLFVKGLVNKP